MPSAFIPSRLGYSAMPLVRQQIHQRPVHPGPLVLRSAPLKYPTPTPDRDRTVSRRSEPSSRTALMGEQPNPWDLLQPQDAMSRHRGAKPLRRCELLGVISNNTVRMIHMIPASPSLVMSGTTDTPEVSPSRSSRTKDSSSQISYAHAG